MAFGHFLSMTCRSATASQNIKGLFIKRTQKPFGPCWDFTKTQHHTTQKFTDGREHKIQNERGMV